MSNPTATNLLDAIIDSWRRNNAIVVNLLQLIPDRALDLRANATSATLGALFGHMHYVRLVFVAEDAPEHGRPLPQREWGTEHDRECLTAMLHDSADAVAAAVRGRIEGARDMDQHYDHPILLLQHLIWHEGYHHGQIKLALKAAGIPLDDEVAGPVTWDVWMHKST